MEGKALALYLIKCVTPWTAKSLPCSVTYLFRDFLCFYCNFTSFLSSILRCITRDDSSIEDDEEDEEEDETPCHHRERDAPSVEDVKLVVERLGMGEWGEGERWREEVDELLEEKEASSEEVKEAFYVFDRDEDGYITPAELWSVMRRLGMREEGVRMEECVKMVSAFDEDGDGRISLLEFKRLLENAA